MQFAAASHLITIILYEGTMLEACELVFVGCRCICCTSSCFCHCDGGKEKTESYEYKLFTPLSAVNSLIRLKLCILLFPCSQQVDGTHCLSVI